MRKAVKLSAFVFVAINLLHFSCTKKGELVPEFDKGNIAVNFTDTVTLTTKLVKEDSLRTDISSQNLLGIYNDPVFGLTSSSFYSQITLAGLNVDFGTNDVMDLDSIVLTLKYSESGVYGDETAPVSIAIHELTDDLSSGTEYYSNTDLGYNPQPIVTKTFVPNITDSVEVGGVKQAPHLRIALDKETFGQKIISKSAMSELETGANFLEYIKGLYITTQESVITSSLVPGEGSIVHFDVDSELSTLTLYYKDSLQYSFLINAESVKYNRFDHNYTGTEVEKALEGLGNDSTVTYLQAMAGVKTKIELPFIKNLKDQLPSVINKAELVVSIVENSEGIFEPLPRVALAGIDADGNATFLPDFGEGEEYFGGALDETTKTYTFNIARHIHNLLYNEGEDYGLYLISSGSSVSANRSVITSESHPSDKMKLNLTYSKL